MEQSLQSRPARRRSVQAMAMMIAGAGFYFLGAEPKAQQGDQARAMSDLERAFWVCDYTASTRRVDMAMGVACMAINEDLKVRKFSGDFDALLAWWRLNKEAMHRTLASAEKPVRESSAPTSPQARPL